MTVNRVNVDTVPYVACGKLNHKGNTFYLRTHVIYGNNNSQTKRMAKYESEFENLYVQGIAYGKGFHIFLV